MSSASNTTTSPSSAEVQPPSYTTFSPPPYVATPPSSYAQSTTSKSSTSKSLLARIHNKKASEVSGMAKERQKMAEEKAIRAAARAAYFSMQ